MNVPTLDFRLMIRVGDIITDLVLLLGHAAEDFGALGQGGIFTDR